MASDHEYVLAIDLGSGGPKVALVSAAGDVVDYAKRPIATHFLPGGGAEQDPEEWWQAIRAAAHEVLGRFAQPVERIVAISCTTQWSVTVPVDQDGRPLMRAVHWTDTRGAPYTKAITGGPIKVAGYGVPQLVTWIRYTGGVPTHSGADALAHILYIKNERPDVYRATHKFLEPMDYINLRLTGRAGASRGTIFPYMLTDNRANERIDYAAALLRWTGIEREKLPELGPVDAVLGPILPEVAAELGLSPRTQVVAGSCDSQAAILGSGAIADFEPHICVGTSSWLTCHVPWKKTDLFRYLATMPSAVRGRNMVVAELGPAGKCVELAAERWFFNDDVASGAGCPYARFAELAASVPAASEGLLYLPWPNGAGPPTGDANARGGFFNQSLRSTRAHACRAVLEGVAGNLRWLLESVEHFIGRPSERLNFIGGGARMDLWCQIMADVLNRPINQLHDPHLAIVRGAGLAAWLALGRIELSEIPARTRVARAFEPAPENRRAYDEMFAALVACYKTNKRLFARLNAKRGK